MNTYELIIVDFSRKTARELYLKECAEKLHYNFKGGAK